jgi:hypothetical protein
MSMASFHALMRSLTAAFLLLLGSATNGRAHISAHRHHSSHPSVAPANPSALLAATPQWKHVDTARPQFLASEAPPSSVRAGADSRFRVVVLVRAHDRPSRPTSSVPRLKSDETSAGTRVPRIALSANTSRQ